MNHTWSLDSEEAAKHIYRACDQIEHKWYLFIKTIWDKDQKEKAGRQETLAFLHKQACIKEVQAWVALARHAVEIRIEADTKFQFSLRTIEKRCQDLEDTVALNCKEKLEAIKELATKETHAALHRIKEFRHALDRVSRFIPFCYIHFADKDSQGSISDDLVHTSKSSLIDAYKRSVSIMQAFSDNVSEAIKIGQYAEEEEFHSVKLKFEDRKRFQDTMQVEFDSLMTKHSKTSAKLSEISDTEHAIKANSTERSSIMIKKIEDRTRYKARKQRQERKSEQKWDDILQEISGSR